MIKVGITGGIGSGKTVVCQIFESMQVPVYYADAAAKRLMKVDAKLRRQVRETFGAASYLANGELNRTYLAEQVFSQKEQLDRLDALVHPAVFRDTERWLATMPAGCPYVLKEAALFFETGSNKQMDVMVTVMADESVRVERIMRRDGVTEQAVRERMANQMDQEAKAKMTDHVIRNNPEEFLIPQVYALQEQLLQMAAKPI